MSKLLIIGAGGHAKVVCDVAKDYYNEIVFADDDKKGLTVLGCDVTYTVEEALNGEKSDFIVAIGNNDVREKLFFKFAKNGFNPVTLIHSSAVIGEEVEIGKGSVVFGGAVINAQASIGCGCIVNTGASVDHDCEIGNFSHVCPGGRIAGTVKCGEKCFFGVGSSVVNDVVIASRATFGAGAVVIGDVSEGGVYVGCPARKIK